MLKAIKKFQIHHNLLKYWFTLSHFALGDPVSTTYYPILKPTTLKKPLNTKLNMYRKNNEECVEEKPEREEVDQQTKRQELEATFCSANACKLFVLS